MSRLRSMFQDAVINLLASIVYLVVIGACGVLANFILSLVDKTAQSALFYIILVVFLLLAVGITVLFLKVYANRYKPRFPFIRFNIKILELAVELELVSEHIIHYKIRYHIKASDKADEIQGKLIFNGQLISPPYFTCNPDCHELTEVEMDKVKNYRIHFLPPLYKNQETNFEIQYTCQYDKKTMDRHLGFRIKWPTERFILRVVTHENLLKNVRQCVYPEDSDELPLDAIQVTHPKMENSYIVYEWNVKRPHLFFYYRFDWVFKEETPSIGCLDGEIL